YLHGHVVNVNGVGWCSRLRGTHRGRCRRRERQGPNELTAGHLSMLVVLKQLADDVLHLLILLLPRFPLFAWPNGSDATPMDSGYDQVFPSEVNQYRPSRRCGGP